MACTDCAQVKEFWAGEPTGEVVTYEGTKAYVAKPKSASQKAILFVPDVYGIDLKNNLLLADKFAQHGYLCIIPDYFGDNPPPTADVEKGNFGPFLKWAGEMGPQITVPLSEKFLKFLRSQGATSTGVIGYCWGGRPAVLLAGKDEVKAVVVNHGSFISPDDMKAIKYPVMLNGADNDKMIPKEKYNEYEEIVKNNSIPHDFKYFDGSHHGWTCKGDTSDPKIGPMIVDAFDRSVTWFNKHV